VYGRTGLDELGLDEHGTTPFHQGKNKLIPVATKILIDKKNVGVVAQW
jgi:hypothetical protein